MRLYNIRSSEQLAMLDYILWETVKKGVLNIKDLKESIEETGFLSYIRHNWIEAEPDVFAPKGDQFNSTDLQQFRYIQQQLKINGFISISEDSSIKLNVGILTMLMQHWNYKETKDCIVITPRT